MQSKPHNNGFALSLSRGRATVISDRNRAVGAKSAELALLEFAEEIRVSQDGLSTGRLAAGRKSPAAAAAAAAYGASGAGGLGMAVFARSRRDAVPELVGRRRARYRAVTTTTPRRSRVSLPSVSPQIRDGRGR